jgi:hypothetical protein
MGIVTYLDDWDPPLVLLAMLAAAAVIAMIYVGFCNLWDRISFDARSLKYLDYRDSGLGSAIITMARQSAWGRWFSAQHLVNCGSKISEKLLYGTAGSIVMDKILDGNIEVRGRRPGQLEYETIPRTHWRSSGFTFLEDSKVLWKLHIIPTGGAQIDTDGTILALDPIAAARNAQLINYDSLIVDAYQFESQWPLKKLIADKKRRKFLREARRRHLDQDEIMRLS